MLNELLECRSLCRKECEAKEQGLGTYRKIAYAHLSKKDFTDHDLSLLRWLKTLEGL